jgi:DNA-binding SARP family transcriptional activator
MAVKSPSLLLQTLGTFAFTVRDGDGLTQVELNEFDAVLITVVCSSPRCSISLGRLRSALFPDSDLVQFVDDINQSVGRVGVALSQVNVDLSGWLQVSDSELFFSPSIELSADFTSVSQQREAIDVLPLKAVTAQLEYDKGEFLGEFLLTPWINKQRLKLSRAFQSLLSRQMELYASEGVVAKAEIVAHKLLQKSPFNLNALEVLTRLESLPPGNISVERPSAKASRTRLDVKLFGPGQICVQGASNAIPLVITGYPRKLLAVLICSSDRKSSKDVLFDTLWPRATKAQARQRLHVALHELRANLDTIQDDFSSLLTSDRLAVGIDSELIASSDIDLLKNSAQTLEKLTIEQIDQILVATSGEFLQGERELNWITQMRRSCDHQVVKLLVKKAEILLAMNRIVDAREVAEQAFDKHPSNEDACAVLMRCHQALGAREQAIDVFDRLRRVLRDEFDMKVSDLLLTLANSIRQNEPINAPTIPLVEMRSVLEGSNIQSLGTGPKPHLSSSSIGSWDLEPIDPTADGAYGGLRRMFLDLLVQTVWVWGPPGLGKKTLIKTVADEFRGSFLCKIHWLETEAILEDVDAINLLLSKLVLTSDGSKPVHRNVVIATWPTTPACIKTLAQKIHQADSKALCVFVCQKFPRVKSCVKLRALGFEAWTQRSGSLEVSPAVNAFCKFAQARGFADLVDRSTVSYLDSLCKYCGGVPGILEELAERLDISPLNLLQGWLSAQAKSVGDTSLLPSDSFTARYSAAIREAAKAEFSEKPRLVLEALCSVRSPVSMYSLADIVGVSRLDAIAAVEVLVEAGLLTTFRSREFDIVFVCISGFTADVLTQMYLFNPNDKLLRAMVSHYGGMTFPRAESRGKSTYRLMSEVLRFEYVWIETALDHALRDELQQDVVKLSRVLRRFYFDAGHVEAAAKFFNRALSSSTDTSDLADFNTVLGGLYGRAGFGRLANKHLLRAIRFARQIKDEIREATAMHSLGLSVGASGRFERGMKFMNSATALYLKKGLLDRELVIIYSSAFLYLNELKLDFPREVLEVKRPALLANRTQSVATWHSVKAYLALFEKNSPLAWHHVTIAIKIAEEINFVQMCFKAQLAKAMLLMSDARPLDAAVTLKRAVRQMIFHDYRSEAAHAMALLALSHVMSRNMNEALEAQIKAEQLLDNVDDMQARAMLAYSRMTFFVASNIPIDETWFRSEVVSKWTLFPAYIRSAFGAYQPLIKSKISSAEFARLFGSDCQSNLPVLTMFESVNRFVIEHVSEDRI